ncbi:hypothetical protein BpHYR1_024939 [Brachionus plicatilis]|uniref:Uncharacterized protein n=1 Tax=Brachionus plicatilis TaxID=10195 RepID=A0A3M7PNL6_BRAPC|nr:hypothetical protein BpHYR1_024939 [Brachionus plicatilis]
MISINEFLGPDAASFFNLFKAIINSFKQIESLKLDWLEFRKKEEIVCVNKNWCHFNKLMANN